MSRILNCADTIQNGRNYAKVKLILVRGRCIFSAFFVFEFFEFLKLLQNKVLTELILDRIVICNI